MKKLFRNPKEGYIGGVCHGLGIYTGQDPIVVRALMVLGMTLGTPIIYLGLWIFLKKQCCNDAGN